MRPIQCIATPHEGTCVLTARPLALCRSDRMLHQRCWHCVGRRLRRPEQHQRSCVWRWVLHRSGGWPGRGMHRSNAQRHCPSRGHFLRLSVSCSWWWVGWGEGTPLLCLPLLHAPRLPPPAVLTPVLIAACRTPALPAARPPLQHAALVASSPRAARPARGRPPAMAMAPTLALAPTMALARRPAPPPLVRACLCGSVQWLLTAASQQRPHYRWALTSSSAHSLLHRWHRCATTKLRGDQCAASRGGTSGGTAHRGVAAH